MPAYTNKPTCTEDALPDAGWNPVLVIGVLLLLGVIGAAQFGWSLFGP